VFGIRTKTVQDEYMIRLYALMDKWSLVQELGATPPVDSFAALRLVPQWLLGNWRNRALEVGDMMQDLYSTVLNRVRDRRTQGIHRGSFMDRVLDGLEKAPLTENQLRFLGGVLMEGGSDTSSSLILTIIQAMIKYPHVQARSAPHSSECQLPITKSAAYLGLKPRLILSLALSDPPAGRTFPLFPTSI
jgi:cytochrome P450